MPGKKKEFTERFGYVGVVTLGFSGRRVEESISGAQHATTVACEVTSDYVDREWSAHQLVLKSRFKTQPVGVQNGVNGLVLVQ